MTCKNHHKILPNPHKIDEKWGLDWSRGLLGEPWESFWLPRLAWDSKEGPDGQNVSQNGSPFGGPFSSFFDICWYIFALCFRDSVLVATRTDFLWILGSFGNKFWELHSTRLAPPSKDGVGGFTGYRLCRRPLLNLVLLFFRNMYRCAIWFVFDSSCAFE